jgi:hypothetical protein
VKASGEEEAAWQEVCMVRSSTQAPHIPALLPQQVGIAGNGQRNTKVREDATLSAKAKCKQSISLPADKVSGRGGEVHCLALTFLSVSSI